MGKPSFKEQIMKRRGNASLRAAQSSGAPSYVDPKVRLRAKKVVGGGARKKNSIAACHRISDKRFRSITHEVLKQTGDSSLPVAKRQKILSSFGDLTDAMGVTKLIRKAQLKRQAEFSAMLKQRAADPTPKPLNKKQEALALASTTDMANHAPNNFFLGDSSNNSSIGERQDARLLPPVKKGAPRAPSPVSFRIAQRTQHTLTELGEPVSPRTKALAGGLFPPGLKTSATD